MRKLSVVLVFLFSILFTSVSADAAGNSQLIMINKKTNTLAFYNAGKLVRTFSVATGKTMDLTPEGKFRIVTMIKNRPYYTMGIPGGDPRNPLGDRWLGLDARGTNGDTYAIHGNNNESSIGNYVSHGCVRMHNSEIRWLFDQVQMYTPVIITNSNSSFEAIAKDNGYNVGPMNGWVQTNGKWYYFVNGQAKSGWLLSSGKWYYLDGTGVMKTGWLSYKGNWYYLDTNGAMKTGWLLDRGKWYYFDSSGAMKTGWVLTGGKWYCFDHSGAMHTGWLLSGGKWYYLQPNGELRTGWTSINGTWYYFDPSGVMHTGWLELSGKKYFLKENGAMATGWVQISGKWYYLNKDGSLAVHTVVNGYKVGQDGAWIQVDYVALGDSLAAGMTPDGQDRHDVNGNDLDLGYPDYIARDFAKSYQLLKFVNFGVSGYKTDDVIDQLGKADVQNEIIKATHLTIDIGANDVLPVVNEPAKAPETINTVAIKLNSILSTISKLNPNVKVYVMGYYNPFPYVTDSQQKAQLNQLLQAFNGVIEQTAKANGDTFVPTAQVINTTDFQKFLPNPQNIHLSLAGYQAVAEEFWKVMQ